MSCNGFIICTLQWQGGGIPGGSHGVQFRPSSQPISCRHQVRDRRKASRERSGASVQSVSGISRRHVPAAAAPAGKAKSSCTRTTAPTLAFTGPLTQLHRGQWPRYRFGPATGGPAPEPCGETELGQRPSLEAKTPASGGLGLTGDRSIAFFTCVWTGNALRHGRFRGPALFAA